MSQALPKSVGKEAVTQRVGSSQQAELGPTIRLLIGNIGCTDRSKWLEGFKTCASETELILLQERNMSPLNDEEWHLNASESYEWVSANSAQCSITDGIKGVGTGCLAGVQQHRVHRCSKVGSYEHEHEHEQKHEQRLLLETHYTLADSKQLLMVLNMIAIECVELDGFMEQLEQLTQVLDQHTGPVILAGDFDSLSAERLALFEACTARSNLIETSMTRRATAGGQNQHLDYIFTRDLSLRSVESLSQSSSAEHAPIMATLVVE